MKFGPSSDLEEKLKEIEGKLLKEGDGSLCETDRLSSSSGFKYSKSEFMFYFSEDYAIIKYRTELTNNLIDALCSGTKASKEDHRDLAIGFVLTLLRNPITFWKLNLIDELAERIGYFPPNKDGLIYYDRINDRFYIYDKESNRIYHNTSINNKILQELLDYIEKVFGQKPISILVNNDFEDYSNLKYLLHSSFNYPPYKLKIETININKRNSMKKIGELEFIIYKFSDKDYNR